MINWGTGKHQAKSQCQDSWEEEELKFCHGTTICTGQHNNQLKLNEIFTLFCKNITFADLQTIYTFHFEVKLYKYVVLGWNEC
jgi:hypothetical protein